MDTNIFLFHFQMLSSVIHMIIYWFIPTLLPHAIATFNYFTVYNTLSPWINRDNNIY